MFTSAIVRTPCKNLSCGLTSADLGKPDYTRALLQHQCYIEALQRCGLQVTILDPDERYPDSTFVEDTALITPRCAILTNPGALSRKGEIETMAAVIGDLDRPVKKITAPGTLDAGDVMMVGSHYYIGLSQRTNIEGARQLTVILNDYAMTGSTITLEKVLHLKTGVAYLENNYLAATGEFLEHVDFQQYTILEIKHSESYAANCVWINDHVLVPAGHPDALETIQTTGYHVIEVNVSEFQKVDGGLSCLSLRF
jgi:dimethylargininase